MRFLQALPASTLALMMLAAGCAPGEQGFSLGPPPGLTVGPNQETDWWDEMELSPAEDPLSKPYFIARRKAKRCPRLEVSTIGGDKGMIEPGRQGEVTIVVFWSMGFTLTRAAARHVSDLVKEHKDRGAAAIGILEHPSVARNAPPYLRRQRIVYPVYVDDFSALRKMGKAAGHSDVSYNEVDILLLEYFHTFNSGGGGNNLAYHVKFKSIFKN